MSEINKNKGLRILSILGIIYTILLILQLVIMSQLPNLTGDSYGTEVIPLFGLPAIWHTIAVTLIFPVFISILFVIFFPIVITPVFLKIKKLILRKYENTYIKVEEVSLDTKKFLIRGIYIFLLTLGISSTLLYFGIISPELFVTKFRSEQMEAGGENKLYNMAVFIGIMGVVLPFAIGLLSIGWAMKDSGLMHYNLSKENVSGLYEIEPIHLRYNAIIKGYAGISAILFYLGAVFFYIGSTDPIGLLNLALITTTLITLMLMSMPAYVIYWKCRPYITKKLTQDLRESEQIYEMKFKS